MCVCVCVCVRERQRRCVYDGRWGCTREVRSMGDKFRRHGWGCTTCTSTCLTSCKEEGEEAPSDAGVQSKQALLCVAPGQPRVERPCCLGNELLHRRQGGEKGADARRQVVSRGCCVCVVAISTGGRCAQVPDGAHIVCGREWSQHNTGDMTQNTSLSRLHTYTCAHMHTHAHTHAHTTHVHTHVHTHTCTHTTCTQSFPVCP